MTLPNHTGMVTGRRIDAARGGHGVNWNVDRARPATVGRAAGERVDSVFTVVSQRRRLHRPVRRQVQVQPLAALLGPGPRPGGDPPGRRRARPLVAPRPAHPGPETCASSTSPPRTPPATPTASCGRDYLDAVRQVDRWLGRVLRTIDRDDAPATTLLLTSDHGGGRSTDHSRKNEPANYRVPFVVRGPGAARGCRPLRAQPGVRRIPDAAVRGTPRSGSRCATAWSPTWRWTCSACRPCRAVCCGADEPLLLTAPTG